MRLSGRIATKKPPDTICYNLWKMKNLIPADPKGQNFILITKDSCRVNKKYRFQCDRLCIDSFDPHKQKSVEELLQLKELFKGDFLEGFYMKTVMSLMKLFCLSGLCVRQNRLRLCKN